MDKPREELQVESVARVAAIDIAKNSGVVCMRLPNETREGTRTQRMWIVAATTNAILELGDHLVCQGVESVVMEATGAYWRPFYYLLESQGLRCWLVNARQVKNVPGRPKTDKLDAVWLARLTERGMIRRSVVPSKPVRHLRDFTRTRTVFVHEHTRHKLRVDKVLQDAQIKLSSVATDSLGVSGRAMMEALVSGERNPRVLAGPARGRLTAKHDALMEALTGQFEEHHARLLRLMLTTVDHLTAQIAVLDQEIAATLADLPDPRSDMLDRQSASAPATASFGADLLGRLHEIPGVGPTSARVILADIGPDMSVFFTPAHLASWAKLCPRTIQSGAQSTTGPVGKHNP